MPSRSGPTKYKVYKCARCSEKRFDVLRVSKSTKTLSRCLEHHIKQMHPDHEGDWTSLIGEITTLERTRRVANPQNNSAHSTPATTPALVSPITPAPQPSGNTATSYRQNLINGYDHSKDYDVAGLARHARNTAAVISTLMKTGHSITVALCAWDQAAIEGKLGEAILTLAKQAFPSQIIDFHNSICSTSHGETGENMVRFYTEKARRFEERIRE